MKRHAHHLGAIFYALWGALHILGGGAILSTLSSEGGVAAQVLLGTALSQSELPTSTNTVMDGVVAYHAFNILWIGVVVLVVAVRLNWRNSTAGYWINLILVSVFDLGLFFTQVFPGRIALSDALIGASLWIPAVVFSTIAVGSAYNNTGRKATHRNVSTAVQGG